MNKKEKCLANKGFYKGVLAVAVPIMVQNGITNFVSLLDNIMVGKLGTETMSGVSIVNQFIFIFYLLIFGAISAAGIFTSQYHGLKDEDGVRYTFRFKVLICTVTSLVSALVFFLFDEPIINLFLYESEGTGDLALTLAEGKKYLYVMLFGLLPYSLSQTYASTMRETGDALRPMIASIIAVAVNFVLNLILIFGLLGFPALGAQGAAIATVISRFAELFYLVLYAHRRKNKFPYLKQAYASFRIPVKLFRLIFAKGMPLMLNECLWSLAMTLRNQCYSVRGLDAVAAQNIGSTLVNVFSVVYLALGTSVSIIVGNLLGAGKIREAKEADRKILSFAAVCGLMMGVLMSGVSTFFPMLYNTSEDVRNLASFMILVSACMMPAHAFSHGTYFTLRSGGQVLITFLLDGIFMWVVIMPLSFVLSRFTLLPIRPLYIICQGAEILKVFLGLFLLKRDTWAKQLVADNTLKQ